MLGLGIDLPTSIDRKPWSPTDIAGLALYLKNGKATAAQWTDASGNANHATQSTGSSRAVAEDGGLNFEGSSDHYYDLTSKITVSTNHNFLVAIVLNIESYDSLNCVLSDGTNEFFEFQTNKKVRVKTLDGSATTSVLTQSGTDFAAGSKMLVVLSRNDGSTGTMKVYKNGAELSDSWSNQANPKQIEFANLGIRNDNDRPLDALVYEVLVYDFGTDTIAATELADLHSHLKSKHSIL